MPIRTWSLVALNVLLAAVPAAAQGGPPGPADAPMAVESIAWLTGCWERATRTGSVEESWTSPRAGTMLGVSRTVRGDSTVAWEHLRIFRRGGRLVYGALPSGQRYTEFTATQASDTLVVFENPAHDFPQRVLYRPAGDSLHARIEGPNDGATRGVDFRFARVRCP